MRKKLNIKWVIQKFSWWATWAIEEQVLTVISNFQRRKHNEENIL